MKGVNTVSVTSVAMNVKFVMNVIRVKMDMAIVKSTEIV